jgi:FkbM family methyltransferase
MPILSHLRTALPARLRAGILRNTWGERLIKACVAREQVRPHPYAPYSFYFDGHRSLGWTFGGLESAEAAYVSFSRDILVRLNPLTVWDVGANVGLWTLFFAGFQPAISHIVAYEPDALNLKLLSRNVSATKTHSVVIRSLALSNTTGAATFQSDPITGSTGTLEADASFITRHYGRPSEPRIIDVTTVDTEIAAGIPAPDFMKIDVEGHEYHLLCGAANLLATKRPFLLLEVTGPNVDATTALLRKHDYLLFDPITKSRACSLRYELAACPAELVLTVGLRA